MRAVRKSIQVALTQAEGSVTPDQSTKGGYFGAMFVDLAYQCASTFRVSDYQGLTGVRVRVYVCVCACVSVIVCVCVCVCVSVCVCVYVYVYVCVSLSASVRV
jgi:hypothetical protein